MTSIEYIETMVRSCERIYMDTATLMDTDGLERFIANSTPVLKEHGRKIIIPRSVRSELARHLGSENRAKADLAMRAVELISQHRHLFEVENAPLTEEEIEEAFADAQILSELTLAKPAYSQLLITNDKKLSADAFSLNQQQSSKGYQIRVCYINRSGELRKCECVGAATRCSTLDKSTMPREGDNFARQDELKEAQNKAMEEHAESHRQSQRSGWVIITLFGILTFCGGVVLGWAAANNQSVG